MLLRWRPAALSLLMVAGACRAASNDPANEPPDATSRPDGPPAADGRVDAPADVIDGPPRRLPCTSSFGTGLSDNTFGRLDGFLVAIVPPGTAGCNSDRTHLHLQVEVTGSTYDVAVNLGNGTAGDVATTVRALPLAQAWQEGWHPSYTFDYVTDLDLHSGDFTPRTQAEVLNELTQSLADVNHISIYATGYGPDGAHLVHRVFAAGPDDGAVVTKPLSTEPQARMFRFSNQRF